MNFLSSPKISLGCAVINAFFALSSAYNGSWMWFGVSGFFAVFCYYNYTKAR